MENLLHLFNDIPADIGDVVVHQIVIMHEQELKLCYMRERLNDLQHIIAQATQPHRASWTKIPNLLLAPLDSDSAYESPLEYSSCPSHDSCVSDLHTDMPYAEKCGSLHDMLHAIVRSDRCWKHLWHVHCPTGELQQWDNINVSHVCDFMHAGEKIFSTGPRVVHGYAP